MPLHWHALIAALLVLIVDRAVGAWSYENVLRVDSVQALRASGMESTQKLWVLWYGDDTAASALTALDDVARELPYAMRAGWISKEVATSIGLQSLTPPLLVLLREKPTWNPYKERLFRPPEPMPILPSQMDLRTLKKLVRERAPSNVLTAWNSSWPPNETRAVLLTKKKTPSLLYKALSVDFPSIRFYLVADEGDAHGQFPAVSLPTLLVGPSEADYKLFPAEKDLTSYDDLASFVRDHAPHNNNDNNTAEPEWLSTAALEAALAEAHANGNASAWLVLAQPETSSPIDVASSAEWAQCVQDIRSKAGLLVRIALVLCDASWCADKPGVYHLPYAKKPSISAASLVPLPSVAASAASVLRTLPDTTSGLYGSNDLNADTLSFVLFTTKDEAPTVFQAVALAYAPRLQFGVVYKPSPEIKAQFGIGHVPSMVAFMTPRDPSVPKEQFSMAFYDKKQLGPPTFENIARFLDQLLASYGPATTADSDVASIVHVHSSESLASVCSGATLCVVSAVADTIAPHEEMLLELARQSKAAGSPVVYVWLDGTCQANVAQQLGIESWHFPSVAVYSPLKHRVATHVGVFDAASVEAFVHSVLYGKTRTVAIDGPLAWMDPAACTARSAEVVSPVVEEDDDEDMADVMAEILADEARQKEARKRALQEEIEAAKKAVEDAATPKKSKKKLKKRKKKTTKTTEKDEL
ncbi:hypothetical protein SPRG_08239 [Saprolegnia parasitica CBS 223.65]|uniref:Thioredoxin domain-containing protein n=1 Tax=Saprolegnia parasitica (strain CBS 223.65) TaxID=695850 RepID=A0A067CIQ9_SAPPC|nr:hypothetical protein SPRG_08239 [Saprolegnia parasitica CBS 223.65]KDO26436.1 hypothetical protein SPRG_08239 [Saprolegnia parasitica CBS 223.65]|eukprot:XP_012202873.1 hypothetical protein SPRG_08239 [Saprolegnia parasitica CBS 223.65]